MTDKVRSVAAAIAYALVGAAVFGGVGVIIAILIDPDAGLEGILNAVIAGGVGAVAGAMLGVVVFVAGGNALEQQQQRKSDDESAKLDTVERSGGSSG